MEVKATIKPGRNGTRLTGSGLTFHIVSNVRPDPDNLSDNLIFQRRE